jgi:pyrimidine-nucleoside phosphorylase/thymidine phosphorylase
MVAIGKHAGVRTEAVITDMDAPLGCAVGNSLEIIECLEMLKGTGPADLTDVVARLATRMVLLAGVEMDEQAARRRVEDALSSGQALHRFVRLIEAQGGNPRVADDYSLLPLAPGIETIRAERDGYVAALRAESLGRASNVLGAGRSRVGEAVDHGVGLVACVSRGARVSAGQPIIELRHRDGRGLDAARALCAAAVIIADEPPPHHEKVLGEVR